MNNYFYCAVVPIFFSCTANAQTVDTTATLQEIIVSGGISPIELRKSGRSISIITSKDLEQNQIQYAVDALRLVSGVNVSRQGSAGSQTVIRMRGSESNQVLVVIDGVAVNDISEGAFYFENLLANDIEQIEILRGPQSTFWGANAMSGVINITTKSGEASKPHSAASAEYGTGGSVIGSLATRGGSETFRYAINSSINRTDGFNISTIGNENDPANNLSFNGKFSADLSESTTLDTNIRFVDRRYDYDDTDWNTGLVIDAPSLAWERTFLGGLKLTNVSMDDNLTQQAGISASSIHRNNIDQSTSNSDGSRINGFYNSSYRFDDLDDQVYQATIGYDFQRENFKNTNLGRTVSNQTNSLIAELRTEFWEQLFITSGARQDWNSDYDDNLTWNVSGDWVIPDTSVRIHSSIGTAVTKPTFTELFGWDRTYIGNPDLKPESSFGWDLGIENAFFDGRLKLGATYFKQNLKNEITSEDLGNYVYSPINNQGVSKRSGIELSATLSLTDSLTTIVNYTYTKSQEQIVLFSPYVQEVRRPPHSGSLHVSYSFYEDSARLFAEVIYNGEMTDTSSRVLPAYTLVNVGGSYQATDTINLYGRVENLFDRSYAEVYGYNSPGITAYAGIRATF